MAKLTNVFSWSHSAAGDFEQCRRKRYWSKYGAWGGWERDASPQCKAAYRLNKMDNRFSLQGTVAEEAVMWMLRQHQRGEPKTPEEAFQEVARGMLRRCWDESTQRAWRTRVKSCCLHEHYYPAFHDMPERDMMFQVADTVKACLSSFHENVLPRLAHVTPSMEIPVAVVGTGDPEHFMFEGVKVYAIPDYVYVEDGLWHIVDWKSGSPKPEHADQVGMYALWAFEKHGVAAASTHLHLEYLQTGDTVDLEVTEEALEQARERIRSSVQDMAQYLVGEDPDRNQPLPREEWDLCFEASLCRRCPFYELCAPELEGLLDEVSEDSSFLSD